MKILNKFFSRNKKKKLTKKEKELLENYDKGLILQVDNGVDNKKHFNAIRQNEK